MQNTNTKPHNFQLISYQVPQFPFYFVLNMTYWKGPVTYVGNLYTYNVVIFYLFFSNVFKFLLV